MNSYNLFSILVKPREHVISGTAEEMKSFCKDISML